MSPPSQRVSTPFMTFSPATGGRGRLVLYASKLAAIAGMNPFVPRQELLDQLRPDAPPVDEKRDVALALAALPEPVRLRVDAAIREGDTDAVVRAADEARDTLPASAASHVVSALFTANGTRSEARIIEGAGLRSAAGGRFLVSRDPWFSEVDVDVYLGGKHDATSADASTIVEVKTRQRRFLGAPLYERVQLHAYMVITGVRSATLVESFRDERREHAVPFDEQLWERVRDAAADFVEAALGALASPPPRQV
jgi:hypothetical protein